MGDYAPTSAAPGAPGAPGAPRDGGRRRSDAWRLRHLSFGSGLLRIVVTYAAGALAVLGLAWRTSPLGLGAVAAAGAMCFVVPFVVRPSMRRPARWLLGPCARAALPLFVGSTAIAAGAGIVSAAAGAASDRGPAIDRSALGPLDMSVEAPDADGRSTAAVALLAAVRSGSNRNLSDADPLSFDLVPATTADGRRVVVMAVPVEPASAFGGRSGETGLPPRSLGPGQALASVDASVPLGPSSVVVAGRAVPIEIIGRISGNGLPSAAALLDATAPGAPVATVPGRPRVPVLVVDPATLATLGDPVGRRFFVGLSAAGDAHGGRLLAGELRRLAERVVASPDVASARTARSGQDGSDGDSLFIEPDPSVVVGADGAGPEAFRVVDLRSMLTASVAEQTSQAGRVGATATLVLLPALLVALAVLVLRAVDDDRRNVGSLRLAGLPHWRVAIVLGAVPWVASVVGAVLGAFAVVPAARSAPASPDPARPFTGPVTTSVVSLAVLVLAVVATASGSGDEMANRDARGRHPRLLLAPAGVAVAVAVVAVWRLVQRAPFAGIVATIVVGALVAAVVIVRRRRGAVLGNALRPVAESAPIVAGVLSFGVAAAAMSLWGGTPRPARYVLVLTVAGAALLAACLRAARHDARTPLDPMLDDLRSGVTTSAERRAVATLLAGAMAGAATSAVQGVGSAGGVLAAIGAVVPMLAVALASNRRSGAETSASVRSSSVSGP